MKENLNDLINQAINIDQESEIPQTIYVIEECSELIKTLTKEERGKGSREEIIDESCDVLTTAMILLRRMGVSDNEIKDRMAQKCKFMIPTNKNDKKEKIGNKYRSI